MPSIDLTELLSPISADSPSGSDLEYDPAFAEMEQAAAGKPEQQMGNSVVEAEEPDWRSVGRNALALLKRTKDLRVSIYLGQASLRTDGWASFRDSLQLTDRLTQDFWETLHPQLDEDDDNDPTARVNAIMTLTNPGLLRAMEATPLVSVPLLGSVTWADVKPVGEGNEPHSIAAEQEAIVRQASAEALTAQRDVIHEALEACQSLESFVTSQVGASQAPNLQPTRDLLKRIDNQMQRWVEQGDSEAAAEDGDAEGADLLNGDDFGESESFGGMPPGELAIGSGTNRSPYSGGPIGSRRDVIASIDAILEYYRQHEPSSPLPLLLLRARRMAGMSFMEVLQEMIPEGLGTACAIGGVSAEDLASFSGGPSGPPAITAKPAVAKPAVAKPAAASPPPPPTPAAAPATDEDDDFFN